MCALRIVVRVAAFREIYQLSLAALPKSTNALVSDTLGSGKNAAEGWLYSTPFTHVANLPTPTI